MLPSLASMREEKAPPSRKSTEAAVVCQSSDAAFQMWTLALGHHEDRSPAHGYAATRDAAMAAFAKSWRRE
jgi:hypothetical protein